MLLRRALILMQSKTTEPVPLLNRELYQLLSNVQQLQTTIDQTRSAQILSLHRYRRRPGHSGRNTTSSSELTTAASNTTLQVCVNLELLAIY